MTTDDNNQSGWAEHKPLQLFLVILIAVAFIGFFVGTRSGAYEEHEQRPHVSQPDGETPSARSYTEMLEQPRISNEHWEESIAELAQNRPDLFDEVENDPEARRRSLADRAELRAYAGAPPTVPHPVKQIGDLACSACHTDGLEVRGRIAPPMSHEYLTNCTQCHVPGESPVPLDDALAQGPPSDTNSFVGAPEAGPGERAWFGAPPQMPHKESMRSECSSCHGSLGRPGMQTTHPWRQNCQQCHAPSAQIDQGMPPATLPPAVPLAQP